VKSTNGLVDDGKSPKLEIGFLRWTPSSARRSPLSLGSVRRQSLVIVRVAGPLSLLQRCLATDRKASEVAACTDFCNSFAKIRPLLVSCGECSVLANRACKIPPSLCQSCSSNVDRQ
jgi:hypothetical protein